MISLHESNGDLRLHRWSNLKTVANRNRSRIVRIEHSGECVLISMYLKSGAVPLHQHWKVVVGAKQFSTNLGSESSRERIESKITP